jgi:hypothetical protein
MDEVPEPHTEDMWDEIEGDVDMVCVPEPEDYVKFLREFDKKAEPEPASAEPIN